MASEGHPHPLSILKSDIYTSSLSRLLTNSFLNASKISQLHFYAALRNLTN